MRGRKVDDMRIDLKALKNAGFEAHHNEKQQTIDIYPVNHRDIAPELSKLTGLPKRDCYILMEDIAEMQVIHAIKTVA